MEEKLKDYIQTINQNQILASDVLKARPLSGGTASNVWLLSDSSQRQYVLKQNSQVNEEVTYLEVYKKSRYLPKVIFFDQRQQFYVYEYLPGIIQPFIADKQTMLLELATDLWSHAVLVPPSKWGWTISPTSSWTAFLLAEIADAKETNSSILPTDSDAFVFQLVQKQKGPAQAYLLHGDCGTHNLLQIDQQVVSVIDPEPLYGTRLFELVATFCSSPEQLTENTLKPAVELLIGTYDRQTVIEEVLIGLYLRIYRCYWHHPTDLSDYLIAWAAWFEKYQSSQKEKTFGMSHK